MQADGLKEHQMAVVRALRCEMVPGE
jgi:hypothetical protein